MIKKSISKYGIAVLIGLLTALPVMAQTAQTITFAALANQTFGAAPLTVSATSTSGLAVTFSSATSAVCTVSGSTVTVLGGGTCTLDANQAGNATYVAAAQVAQSFTVAQEAQTLTFPTVPTQSFSPNTVTLAASSTSGMPPTYLSQTPSVCTVSASMYGKYVSLVSVGTCTIEATQPGNPNVIVAPPVTQSFSVVQAAQSITFAPLAGQNSGTAPYTISATATSGLAVAFSSATSAVCTVSGSTVTLVSIGTCTINANQAGNANFSAATQVAQSFSIRGAQTLTFPTVPTQAFSLNTVTLAASSTSGMPPTYISQTPSVCTVSASNYGQFVSLVSLGTCTIEATQPGNPTIWAAPPVTQSFLVVQASQSITFAPLAGQNSGTAPYTISATSTSGLAVAFTSATTPVCTVSGSTVTLVSIGTCTINANQAGNANVSAAVQVAQSFSIRGSQTLTFPTVPTQAFSPNTVTLTASSTSGMPPTYISQTPSVCTVSASTYGKYVSLVSLGTCTIEATQPGNPTIWAAPPVTQSFSVIQGPQTVTFAAVANQVLGAAPLTMSATSTSGLAVAFTSATTPVCTVSGSTVTLVGAGTCTINANLAGNTNYSAAPQVSQSFSVGQEAQTISFNAPANQQFGAVPFVLSATSTSALAISFTSSTTPVCTVSGSTVTLASAGICTIAANQVGSSNYSAAAPVTQSFTVTPAPLMITLTSPTTAQSLTAPATLTLTATATDSSGTITQVAFFNGTGLMGTVTQPPYSIVIPNAIAGTYQITAQMTDNNGLTATSAAVNIAVAAGSGSKTEQIYYINADQLNTPRLITDSDGNTVWQWDGEAFGSTPPKTEVTGAGQFTFNLRYPGQYYDAETNLHYNYFRDYDPTTGRYAESDPFGLYAGISTFSYVASN
ncbi:RHS repeat-associated core domain-containing protein, partial [Solimicrobium silvestre]|uniref:RHS repeat-associated core domain-containing protein n=1 Tax=Solimicrobium silvestre TaxID=2099400 RepID=UPI001FAF93F0